MARPKPTGFAAAFTALFMGLALSYPSHAQTKPRDIDGANDARYDVGAKMLSRPKTKSKYPASMRESGYCCMLLDVDSGGIPRNVKADFCTHAELAAVMTRRMAEFRFMPAIKNEKAVVHENKIFRLGRIYGAKSAKGSKYIVPGPNGYLTRKNPKARLPPGPKNPSNSKWLKQHFNTEKTCGFLVS